MSNQKGMSILGMLVFLLIASFFLTVAFKIGPLYIDNSFVRESVKSLEQENFREMSNRQIARHIQTTLDINNVRDVSVKDLVIERDKYTLLVKLDYERRVHFMQNVDVVVVFENHFDSTKL